MKSPETLVLPLILGPLIVFFGAMTAIGIAQMLGLRPRREATVTSGSDGGDSLLEWFGGEGCGDSGGGGGGGD
jgi:hypothetical protein